MKKDIRVCVFGLGYIGLPTSLLLAQSGFLVTGVDTNEKVINSLKANKVHISEPSLNYLLQDSLAKKTFIPALSPCEADIFLIAVPTPFKKNNDKIPSPDISYIMNAVEMISKVYKPKNLVILESTSPVGTTDKIYDALIKKTSLNKKEIFLAYCPERVLPGKIMKELVNNNRVIGGVNDVSTFEAHKFYKKFCNGKITKTNSKTAELVKLTENSFRDVNIAFSNEISMICHNKGINPKELINLANDHPRVNILDPGCGVGGHCIAVDPWFIASQDPDQTPLIQTARQVNNFKTNWCLEIIKNEYEKIRNLKKDNPKIGCLGITYKPDVDDLRESPALEIAQKLYEDGIDIFVCEPNIKKINKFEMRSLDYVLENSDIIILLVAHKEFKKIEFKKYNILDFCYLNS